MKKMEIFTFLSGMLLAVCVICPIAIYNYSYSFNGQRELIKLQGEYIQQVNEHLWTEHDCESMTDGDLYDSIKILTDSIYNNNKKK